MQRPLWLAVLLVATVLSGCASVAPDAAPADAAPAGLTNVGGALGKSVVSVPPGTYDLTGPYSRVLVDGPLAILPPERVTIPSPIDGAAIEMGINRPETAGRVPILVFASPYFDAEGSISGTLYDAAPDVAGAYYGPERPVTSTLGSYGTLISNFVPHGYAVVALAVRGTAGSDGCNDLMGPDEITDLDAAITWLGEQEWSTGAIAMTGVSYDGSTPWSVASTGNPYLKTIIPISGVPDIYGLMYRNGSSESRGPALLNALYIEGSYSSGEPASAPGRLCPEAYEGLALSVVAGLAGSDPTGYWAIRNRKPGVEANYQGSVFSIQGLQDWNVDPSQVIPWVDELEARGLKTKQLLGQWGHAWPDGIGEKGVNIDCSDTGGLPGACARADWKESLLRWLDSELKGLDVDTGAAVQVRDSMGRWRNEEHFPPHDATQQAYHLDTGFLAPSPGDRHTIILVPTVDEGIPPQQPPAVATDIKSLADFELGPVERDLLISGLPKLHLSLTPQGPGGYIGSYLYSKSPDGELTRLGWTTMNLAYADGTTTRTEVIPGQTIRAKMEIQPMDGVVPAGHSLVLRVWVFTDGDRLPTLPPAPVSLEIGGEMESVLVIPTIERDASVYFVPPTVEAPSA
ncbi:MAG: CocE/NonD family hydrolase [Candidatus Thermoplasmatota archaeon]